MPIAARVVGVARRAAIVASLDMAAERRCAACGDGVHDASFGPTDMTGLVTKIRLAVPAQNISDLDDGPVEESFGARLPRRHDLQRKAVQRARRRSDRMRGELRIARRRRQVVMSERSHAIMRILRCY